MLEKIPHYALTSSASIYDEEALTALELAGRTAHKVNECVEAVNDHKTETDETLAREFEELRAIVKHNPSVACFLNGTPRVDFDVSSVTLTVPNNLHIYVYGKTYTLTDATVTRTHDHRSLFLIAFNFEKKALALKTIDESLDHSTALIGQIYQDQTVFFGDLKTANRKDSERHVFYAKCFADKPAYTEKLANGQTLIKTDAPIYVWFGGVYYNALGSLSVTADTNGATNLFGIYVDLESKSFLCQTIGDVTPQSYVNIGIFHRYNGVMLNTYDEQNRFAPVTPCALILGDSSARRFIEFDSVNKKVKIPHDTLIMFNGGTGSPVYFHKSIQGERVVSYAGQTSSALKVVYNSLTDEVEVMAYSLPFNPYTHYLLAVFRTNGSVSITAPFKWDGKPYNIEVGSGGSGGSSTTITRGLRNPAVKSIAHRGLCTEAPENTLSAFRLAAERGFNYVECDVRLTRDGVPVLIHDETVDRTSNGTGNVSDMTYGELSQLDFGSWLSADFAGEKIPTLTEFLTLCRNKGLHPYIELKGFSESDTEVVIHQINYQGMIEESTVICDDTAILNEFKNVGVRTGLVCSGAPYFEEGDEPDFIDMHFSQASDGEGFDEFVYARIPIEVWGVTTVEDILNTHPYVSGYTADGLHAGKILYERG